MTDMAGPVTDGNPPLGGMKSHWKFTNKTGGNICDLYIECGGGFWNITNEMRKITIKAADGSIIHTESFGDTDNKHFYLPPDKCISDNSTFTVHLEFDSHFDAGEWIHFSPTDENHENIVASVAPLPAGLLASAAPHFPQPVADVATIFGLLPIPFWTPVTAPKSIALIIRLIMRALRSLRLAGAIFEMDVTPQQIADIIAEELAVDSQTTVDVNRDDTMESIASRVFERAAHRRPAKHELRALMRSLRALNQITDDDDLGTRREIRLPS